MDVDICNAPALVSSSGMKKARSSVYIPNTETPYSTLITVQQSPDVDNQVHYAILYYVLNYRNYRGVCSSPQNVCSTLLQLRKLRRDFDASLYL